MTSRLIGRVLGLATMALAAATWGGARHSAAQSPAAKESPADLEAERNRLAEEARRLDSEGNYAEALVAVEGVLDLGDRATQRSYLEQALAIDEKAFGAVNMATMQDDGYLSADEIALMPLGGAELVVLSACESGLGQTAGGEGMLGIQRAFQVAGARSTIATLWKVNDEATRRIMEEFYRNYLTKKMSPLEALRAAQLWALNNPDLVPRGADPPADAESVRRLPPRYWAAFTLSGDWR